MEVKLRVMLFVLLVTLFSVTGQDFTFYWTACKKIKHAEILRGVTFQEVPSIDFADTEIVQEWVANVVGEEGSKRILISPVHPGYIAAAILVDGDDRPEAKRLSRMSISFSKVKYRLTRGGPNEMETHYGKFGLCFNNRVRRTSETCVYTLMFSDPDALRQMRYVGDIAFKVNPISAQQLHGIKTRGNFMWSLDMLDAVLSKHTEKCGLYSQTHAQTTDLGISLQQGGSAFFLSPIIVDEPLLREYYALVN